MIVFQVKKNTGCLIRYNEVGFSIMLHLMNTRMAYVQAELWHRLSLLNEI